MTGATLPPPVKGHEQTYGYCASKKWVHELALRCVTKLHPELSYREACSNAAINPSYGIGKALRIHSLCTGSTFVPSGHIIPEEYMSEGYVFVLYICTDLLKSYRWRPTQKQVDELSVLVREPQWWVDHVP